MSLQQSLLHLSELAAACAKDGALARSVEAAAELMRASIAAGQPVLVCGNGGSAADAQHFVAELVVKMGAEREAIPALSLTTDPSVMTACANDFGYERVFARQVEALGRPGGCLLGISTSGSSANVLAAFEVARSREMATIALTGERSNEQLQRCDVQIAVPSGNTQLIQELHMPILHGLVSLLEQS